MLKLFAKPLLALTLFGAAAFSIPAQSSAVAFQQMTMLQSAVTVSRWQDTRFGPIVSSDTLWTIASYYGRKRSLTVYAMMDLIVAANPRVFINGQPDRMMDGYYLDIPRGPSGLDEDGQINETVQQSAAAVASGAVADNSSATETSGELVPTAALDNAEMEQMRVKLSESIDLIEQLQTENNELQSQLKRVNQQLSALQDKVDIERQAEIELQRLAAEVTEDAALQAKAAAEAAQLENVQSSTPVEPDVASVESTPAAQEPVIETATAASVVPVPESEAEPESKPEPEPEETVVEATTKTVQAPVKVTKEKPNFLTWLLQPPQLWLALAVPLVLALIIWYVWYVRRLSSEQQGTYSAALDKSSDARASQVEEQQRYDERVETAVDEVNSASEQQFSEVASEVAEDEDALAEDTNELENSTEAVQTSDDGHDLDMTQDETPVEPSEVAADDPLLTDLDWDEPELPEDEPELPEEEPELPVDEPELPEEEPELSEEEPELSEEESESPEDELDSPEPLATTDTVEDELESPEKTDNSIEFTLDDIDFSDLEVATQEPSSPDDSETPEVADSTEDFVPIEQLLDEADADLDEDQETEPYQPSESAKPLGEIEQSSGENELESSKSPAAQLDLAQAYIEMGETDEARELLERVMQSGDSELEREAAQLLQQMDGQSSR